MEAEQAETLSQILGQTATREDLGLLRAEMNGRFAQMDERLASIQLQLDTRLGAMQLQLDTRLQGLEDSLHRKLSDLESRMTWRIVGAMTALTAVFAAIVGFLG